MVMLLKQLLGRKKSVVEKPAGAGFMMAVSVAYQL